MSLYPNFSFQVTKRDETEGTHARAGLLETPHGTIETPNYIFCATKGTIKGLAAKEVKEAGAQIILSNTYHLLVQPGAEIIEKAGGLHEFTTWEGPMLTDSGGYQIFSLQYGGVADEIKGRRRQTDLPNLLLSIDEDGVTFRNHLDGSKLFISPEVSIDTQRRIGADLIVAFDELTAFHDSEEYTARSMERTHRWEDRSLEEFRRGNDGRQALYGVVQGGVYEKLRRECCEYTRDRDFFGTAIGGCLGKDEQQMREVVSMCVPHIHPDRPVHLLGIGRIKDVFEFVRLGIDTFDCVAVTRMARHGTALIKGDPKGSINLRNSRFRDDFTPLDSRMPTEVSRTYSKASLHHLLKAEPGTAGTILTRHNIGVISTLMQEIRSAIRQGTLRQLEKEWLNDNLL